ncbi:microsomal signal peptidase 25 kDa subunit-domain-containing protein [Cokeromyces recurvatus]|uniref:microsomal signal peptidase 25 kDa subunit-domain-containing protein n=1 Tax=Cokeromyces recurvatus TaxID=90255 RepID=UPI00221F5FDE|nr:microsomal signal peptidase 25 kDa subunit-domain-containing protein [Cokeromyces recurvatus]XP_051380174.1 microsomal signal peptidase 25 kDa subunit-domain-containing protein [Cokeromyces recurvatus]KAI7899097.1 microsomal signal peptidase 25 kDa subunit-domain-containing protein [Cokeromyces recurvatus]KAI7900189.1 microsomal signal peptidase 25 kDa subunit-domain-containing protein [Cokeromyces recurvatus]
MTQTITKEEALDPVEVTNKYDATQLRNAVDDELSRYYSKEQHFTQSHVHTDFKLILGFISCFIAGGAFLNEYKTSFNEALHVTTMCVIVYWILQSILLVYTYFVEKGEIFVGHQKVDGKVTGTLKISSEFDKTSPLYKLTMVYSDRVKGKTVQSVVNPNMTTWFNEKGVLIREVMDKDLNNYLLSLKQNYMKNNIKTVL